MSKLDVDKPGITSIHIVGRSSYQVIDRFIVYHNDLVTAEESRDIANKPSKSNYGKLPDYLSSAMIMNRNALILLVPNNGAKDPHIRIIDGKACIGI